MLSVLAQTGMPTNPYRSFGTLPAPTSVGGAIAYAAAGVVLLLLILGIAVWWKSRED